MNLGGALIFGALVTCVGCRGGHEPAQRAVSRPIVDASALGLWRDRTGRIVPDGMHGLDTVGLVAELTRGPQHCDLTSAYFLWIAWPVGRVAHSMAETREFVRDPRRLIPKRVATGPFAPSATLPADARDTGLHRGPYRLFVASDGNAAFVGKGTRYERWPRIRDFGCL